MYREGARTERLPSRDGFWIESGFFERSPFKVLDIALTGDVSLLTLVTGRLLLVTFQSFLLACSAAYDWSMSVMLQADVVVMLGVTSGGDDGDECHGEKAGDVTTYRFDSCSALVS